MKTTQLHRWAAMRPEDASKAIDFNVIAPPSKTHITPDGIKDIEGPICRQLRKRFCPPAFKTGLFKDGIGFKATHVNRYLVAAAWAASTESGFMNVIEQLGENYEAAAGLWSKYEDRLKAFRAAIKNDVASLEAAARKSTEATNKMVAAYGHVIETLNSSEMATAVSNAERLAAAMHALANLESHRLVLSVTEQDKTA